MQALFVALTVVAVLSSAWTIRASVLNPRSMADGRQAVDYRTYMDATDHWLAGESFYPEWQTAGPYRIPTLGDAELGPPPILYPPPSLVLFVPFALAPRPLSVTFWYAIPLLIIAWAVWRHRPSPWAWPLIVLAAMWQQTFWLVLSGNPAALWCTAAVALGTVYGWPALAVALRPTLLPLMLIGAHRRTWWVAAAAGLAVSAVFLPMWPDYVAASVNAQGSSTLYLWQHYVLVAVPLLAWAARRSR